jgi:hypothetical protein
MKLCCQVNPKAPCILCKTSFCKEHLYKTKSEYLTIESNKDRYTCIYCFDKKVRKPFLARRRKGLTFKELFREARLLLPHGYMSIDVSLDDHSPGEGPFKLEWTIYHEKHNHLKGATPEEVLNSLRKILEIPPEKEKSKEILDI